MRGKRRYIREWDNLESMASGLPHQVSSGHRTESACCSRTLSWIRLYQGVGVVITGRELRQSGVWSWGAADVPTCVRREKGHTSGDRKAPNPVELLT